MDITGITIIPGPYAPERDAYVALPGARLHGADFVAQAAGLGAAAGLRRHPPAPSAPPPPACRSVVENPRGRYGQLAAEIYGVTRRRPPPDRHHRHLRGSTTAYLVEGYSRGAGRSTGLVGTVEMRIGDERIKSERTTPEATDLQALFAVMRERGVDAVAMEVSSHALVLGRVDGCVFDVAVFNNLSPQHMEFHSDMDDYYRAKAGLFTPERSRLGVVNLDDEYGRRLAGEAGVRLSPSPPRAAPTPMARRGRRPRSPTTRRSPPSAPGRADRGHGPAARPVQRRQHPRRDRHPGHRGHRPEERRQGVAAVPGVPGRLERVDAGQPYLAVVDYAHKETDAVESVLRSLREVTEGRLHVVIGRCGGDRRDTTKCGPMGAATARLADTAVLTSDNPRSDYLRDPLRHARGRRRGPRGGARRGPRPRRPRSRRRRRRGPRAAGRHRPGRGQGPCSRARTSSPGSYAPSTTARSCAPRSSNRRRPSNRTAGCPGGRQGHRQPPEQSGMKQ
ncbi:Mur ligase family protein [Streptomyces narbonensis]